MPLSIAAIVDVKRALAIYERRILMLRRRLANEPVRAGRIPRHSEGRGNSNLRRFVLEAVRKQPGLTGDQIAQTMASKGFAARGRRPLRTVVAIELRRLVKDKYVREDKESIFSPIRPINKGAA